MVSNTDKWDEEKIMSVLVKSSGFNLKLTKAFEGIEKPFTVLTLVDPKDQPMLRSAMVKKYMEKDACIIYITLSTGYNKLKEDFEKEKINTKDIQFIDMVSKDRGVEIKDTAQVKYVESPMELTDCLIKMDKLISENKEKTIVILDSVSTMLVYNQPTSIEKFVHSLIGKISVANASAILFSSNAKESKSITNTIGHFVDKIVEL
ncbi:MAG TPA: ATPase domain-containing protein [archaeon]|nr:ATPase domain-containing protein [archaeon]